MFGTEKVSPELLLGLGSGLLSGRTWNEQVANAGTGALTAVNANKEKQARDLQLRSTADFLRDKDPQLAAMVQNGSIQPADAYKQYLTSAQEKAKASQPDYQLIMAPDGRLIRAEKNSGQIQDLGSYSKPDVPAEYKDFQKQAEDPAYAKWRQEQLVAKDAPTAKDKMNAELDVRKTYRAEPPVKAYQTVKAAYQKGRQAAAMDSAAGDMSLVYAFMKMQDPESVVREGEYATAEKAGSVQDWVVNVYNRVRTGQRLTEQQKLDFVKAMDEQYAIAAQGVESTNKQYEPFTDEYGLPKDRLLIQPDKFEPMSLSPGQKVETTVNGKKATIERVSE